MPFTLEQIHDKTKSYDWPFTVGDSRPKHPTKYIIPPKGKDPFRMLVRDSLSHHPRHLIGGVWLEIYLDETTSEGVVDALRPSGREQKRQCTCH